MTTLPLMLMLPVPTFFPEGSLNANVPDPPFDERLLIDIASGPSAFGVAVPYLETFGQPTAAPLKLTPL
jgi:hypothetical protein